MINYWTYARKGTAPAVLVSLFILSFPVIWAITGDFECGNFFIALAFVVFIWAAIFIGNFFAYRLYKKRNPND
jgi:hypothetical protein